MAQKKRLGEMLMEAGVIGETQLKAALGHQRQWGVRLGQALVDLKLATEPDIVRALAEKYGFEVARLDALEPYGLEQALALLPREFVLRNNVFPMAADTASVTVAMSDPTNLAIADEIRFRTGRRVKVCIGGDREVAEAVARHYPGADAVEAIDLDLDADDGGGEAVFDPFGGGSKDALEAFFGSGAAADPAPAFAAEPDGNPFAPAPAPAVPADAPSAASSNPFAAAPVAPQPAPPAPAAPPVAAPARTRPAAAAQAPGPAPVRPPAPARAAAPAAPRPAAVASPAGAAVAPAATRPSSPAIPRPAAPQGAAPAPRPGAAPAAAARPSTPASPQPAAPAPARPAPAAAPRVSSPAAAAAAPAGTASAPAGPAAPLSAAPRPAVSPASPAPARVAAPARPARPAELELEDRGPSTAQPGDDPAPALAPLSNEITGGEPILATELAPDDGGPESPIRDLTERELEILGALDRLAAGGHAEPEIVRPTQAMAALVRLMLRKHIITEAELVDELSRK